MCILYLHITNFISIVMSLLMKKTILVISSIYGSFFSLNVLADISSAQIQPANLESIIISLYGGDGVQLITSTAGFSHSPHFQDDALQELNQLTQGTLDSKLPTPSTSSGIIYQYDASLDDFVQSNDSLGPIFVERANTLGSGNMMFGFNYSSAHWDTYNNKGLHNINLVLDHRDLNEPGSDICIGGPAGACYLFEEDDINLTLDINFQTKAMFFFSAYGITDKWDVGLMVPVVKNSLSVKAYAVVNEDPSSQYFAQDVHLFDEHGINGDAPMDALSGSKSGIGDILLFSKYNLVEEKDHQLALSFVARLDTGDKANLMGFDSYGFKTSVLSSHYFDIANMPFKLHINIGYDINAGVLGQDEIDYALALEQPIEWSDSVLALSYEIIGEKDINKNRDHNLDAAISMKYFMNEFGILSLSGRVPLNNDGLRASFIYVLGYEIYF